MKTTKKMQSGFWLPAGLVLLAAVFLACEPVTDGDEGGGTKDTAPPAPVTNLTVEGGTETAALSWTNPTDADFDHAEITFSPIAEGTGQPITVPGPGTSKNITGLVNGQLYTFTVRAVDTSGNASKEASVSYTPKEHGYSTKSVEDVLQNETVTQQEDAGLAEFITANYDPDLKYIVLTYKVGTIKNMFLQYLSTVVAAAPGRELTYTEIVGHSETEQTENINTTAVRFGGTVQVAFAGASAFAGLASLSSLGPQAKASAYAVAGKLSFDIASVTTSRYTHTYQNWLIVSNELKQDMGIYPTGKKYAVAAFADVGIYQILKYDPQTRTASAIPGKSLWFNVESRPYWDVYEYSREEELSIPQQLEPFERVNVEVSESDLYKALSKTYAKTRSSGGNEDLTGIRYSSTDETYKPDLFIPALKQFGYTKLRIDVEFAYKGDWVLFGVGALRLQIANSNKSTELGRKDFDYTTSWTTKSYSVTVPIDAVNSDTGQFMLLWSRVENDGLFSANQSVGKRTVTITALK